MEKSTKKKPKYLMDESEQPNRFKSTIKEYSIINCPNCGDEVRCYPNSYTNCPTCGTAVTV